MKRFLMKLAVLFLPIFTVIITVNILVDPANIYKDSYEEKIADILLAGDNVTEITNYDERLLQKHIIEQRSGAPPSIVLGSSRILQVDAPVLEYLGMETEAFNHGVSGGNVLDVLGIMGLYAQESSMPSGILLGLDPWMFNDNSTDTRYKSIESYAEAFEHIMSGTRKGWGFPYIPPLPKELQCVSLTYFQSSLDAIKAAENPWLYIFEKQDEDYPAATANSENEGITRLANGAFVYGKAVREYPTAAAEDDARRYIAGASVYQLKSFASLSERYTTLFESFIHYCESQDIEIKLYLPPYPPTVYGFLSGSDEYAQVEACEAYILQFAADNDIEVYGSYDPAIANCGSDDFFDGMHLRREAVYKSFVKR